MLFSQYLAELQSIAINHPESLNYQVVSSSDDEGNYFNTVHWSPSIGEFNDGEVDSESTDPNAICVN